MDHENIIYRRIRLYRELISDLAQAHMLALEKLIDGAPSSTYNLGNGDGYSVLEVIRRSTVRSNKKG